MELCTEAMYNNSRFHDYDLRHHRFCRYAINLAKAEKGNFGQYLIIL